MSRPRGKLVVAYGGGVNSVAVLVHLRRLGLASEVAAIVMSDPGSERAATVRYRDEVLPPYLAEHGFPAVTVVTRIGEGAMRPRAWRLGTLYEECYRTASLPSVAYGWGKCSQKYKAQPANWWAARQSWARDTWARGERLVRVIGYDADEPGRVRDSFSDPVEASRFVPWYPLVDARLTREDCEALIESEGLPLPGKSACTFCPHNARGVGRARALRARGLRRRRRALAPRRGHDRLARRRRAHALPSPRAPATARLRRWRLLRLLGSRDQPPTLRVCPVTTTINDRERELWVLNDEGLHIDCKAWMRRNRGGMRGYIRAHRDELDAAIRGTLEGARRTHDTFAR